MANVIRKRAVIARSVAEPSGKNDDLKDLYIFGYQCTLFRDDEKALFIDQGRHLIPWMGNDNLLIDRYDGRGHLQNLSEYDADNARGSAEPLSEEEKQIEKLCDEERYLELNTDILEKMLYEEEEMKRLNEALASDNSYCAVGFNYESGTAEEQPANSNTECEDEDLRPYVPKPTLNLPKNIQPPKTEKIHAIIERTAAFTAKHGVQMEIMLKAKQKDNPQFGFLNYEDELNAYYKHLVDYIKQGKYIPATAETAASSDKTNGSEENHAYLHPSLSASSAASQPEPEPEPISSQAFLESVSAKLPAGQIANTPYAKLLSNLSKHTRANSPKPVKDSGDLAKASLVGDGEKVLSTSRSLPSLSSLRHESSRPGSPADAAYAEHPPVPGLAPVTLPLSSSSRRNQRAQQSLNDADNSKNDSIMHGPTIIPPPPDCQPIIDKMADYVARNGPEFEFVVRRRNDERFRFLDDDHPHYAYYQHKKSLFIQEIEKKKAAEAAAEMKESEQNKQDQASLNDRDEPATNEPKSECRMEQEQVEEKDDKSVSKGVSFMIKTKEEEAPILKKTTALLYESSDSSDDEDENEDEQRDSESNSDSAVSAAHVNGVARVRTTNTLVESGASPSTSSKFHVSADKSFSPSTGATMRKQVERLADKLAMAAREKLVQANREKQLQAQRKHKAAVFLNLIRQSNPASPADGSSTVSSSVDLATAPEPYSIQNATSRSATPATSVPSPYGGSSPAVDRLEHASSPRLVASTSAPVHISAATSASAKSPRHHKHRSRSHSRSSHRKRSDSRSRSKKHHKRKKSRESRTSSSRRSRSKSPRRKDSPSQTHSHGSRHNTDGASELLLKSSKHSAQSDSRRSSKKRRRSKDREKSRHKSRRHHKSKKSHRSARSRSRSRSSSLSSSSSSPVRPSSGSHKQSSSRRSHKSKRHRRHSSTASSRSSDVNIIEILDDPPADSSLLEVQAMLQAKRKALLAEEIVILD